MTSSSCRRGAAEWWTYRAQILNIDFMTKCYNVVVILRAFCSVIKRHELLPIAIWSNMTRIRQVAPLLHIINSNNLCFRVENETTLISAKNRVDLSSISEVRSYITEWSRFLGHPVYPWLQINSYSGAIQLELSLNVWRKRNVFKRRLNRART